MSRRTDLRPWLRVVSLVIPVAFAVLVVLDQFVEAYVLSVLEILLAPLVLGLAVVSIEAFLLLLTRRGEERAARTSVEP